MLLLVARSGAPMARHSGVVGVRKRSEIRMLRIIRIGIIISINIIIILRIIIITRLGR